LIPTFSPHFLQIVLPIEMGFIPAEGLLLGVDADPEAQVMMVEQFIAEAE
jgi:hypothetical protein